LVCIFPKLETPKYRALLSKLTIENE
jgi:hypothetical protein